MDVHARELEVTEDEMERAQLLLEAFMFPNRALTEGQQQVMKRAARYQAEHDLTLSQSVPPVPEDVSSMQIGHFQIAWDTGTRAQRDRICPSAYALLLREGLLYRGVEREMAMPTPKTGASSPAPEAPRPGGGGLPPLRPGVKPTRRDAWLPYRRKEPGNPPPDHVPPQGSPPLPGLPVRRGGDAG